MDRAAHDDDSRPARPGSGPRDWSPADDDALADYLSGQDDRTAFGASPPPVGTTTVRRALGWALLMVGLATLVVLVAVSRPSLWLGGLCLVAIAAGLVLLVSTLRPHSQRDDDGAVV